MPTSFACSELVTFSLAPSPVGSLPGVSLARVSTGAALSLTAATVIDRVAVVALPAASVAVTRMV